MNNFLQKIVFSRKVARYRSEWKKIFNAFYTIILKLVSVQCVLQNFWPTVSRFCLKFLKLVWTWYFHYIWTLQPTSKFHGKICCKFAITLARWEFQATVNRFLDCSSAYPCQVKSFVYSYWLQIHSNFYSETDNRFTPSLWSMFWLTTMNFKWTLDTFWQEFGQIKL